MSYTPTTWNTGDTVTASAMNKIENGIANAGGGSLFFKVTTTNFPTSGNVVAYIQYVTKNGNSYEATTIASIGTSISVYGNTTLGIPYGFPIPTLENNYLVFAPTSGVTVVSSSGGIETTPITVEDGAPVAYIITGDFTITLSGWA